MEIHTSLENLSNLKPALTIGVFDGVHLGHKKLLSLLKSEAKAINAPTMVVTFWPHPFLFFNPDDKKFRLLMSIREKEMILRDIGIDHLVVLPFDKELAQTPADDFAKTVLVDSLRIRHLVVGDDHRFGKGRGGSFELVKKLAAQFGFGISGLDSFTSDEVRISSTFIRSCLMAGDLASANRMLGYPYFILGNVESGKQIGRQIGFPTANISCCEGWKQIPQDGVYVVKVKWNGSEYGGMLNIGTRPTVENTGRKSIEVHLFGHSGELYGEELKVSFHRRLREEMRFNNLDELRAQLEKDKINALAVLQLLE
ncbi:MAG: bifunctional riboflavin kinase/FAD synthetase [Bacteroidota bacterium]|nr:bifunctional riboflavin kinase/FAD synthetase [Bacteroidota bacterium]